MAPANHKDLVVAIKADLIRRGIIPDPQETNCHAFEITGRVAWQLRNEGTLLFLKSPGQNGCNYKDGNRYSMDAIAYTSGGFVDCLGSAGPPANANNPQWDFTPGPPPTSMDGLAVPFDLDAGSPVPVPEPSDCECQKEFIALSAQIKQLQDRLEDLIASENAVYAAIDEKLNKILAKP